MGKIKNLKSKYGYLIGIILIILLGLYLRIMGLDKPEGFWYDEALSFANANQSFPMGILQKLYSQDFHAPLYYFFLHFWMKIVDYNELLIRISSVIFGVAALPVYYLVGKELGSKKAGRYALILAAVNSSLIYYSQEVRFYSLLTLLSAITLLFMAKIKNNPNKFNIIGLAVTNLIILYTYTVGNLYVFLEVLFLLLYLFFNDKKIIKPVMYSQAIVALLYLPFLVPFVHFSKMIANSIVGSFWWIQFGFASPILVLQDWFTPILVNLRSHPIDYYNPILLGKINLFFILFICMPIAIYLIGIVKTLLKRDFATIIFLVGFGYFFTEIILASQGKLGLMTRYTIIALPAMIVTAAYGLSQIKNTKLAKVFIVVITVLSLFWLFFSPESASKMPRDGYKKYIVELEKFHPTKNDIILIPYGGRFFEGYYLNNKATILPLDLELMYSNNKNLDTVFDSKIINSISKDKYKNYGLLRSYIGMDQPSRTFDNYVKENIAKKMKKNSRVFIIISGGINPFTPQSLHQLVSNDYYYINTPIFLMLSSKTINDLFFLVDKYLHFTYKKNYMNWQLYVFDSAKQKLNNKKVN